MRNVRRRAEHEWEYENWRRWREKSRKDVLPPARGHRPRTARALIGPSPKYLSTALRFRRLARRLQALTPVSTNGVFTEFPSESQARSDLGE